MNPEARQKRVQWRKRLEQRGWFNAKRFPPPHHHWIEYHVIWNGRIWSGRCVLADCSHHDYWQPGTHLYLIQRQYGIDEGVWRRCEPPLPDPPASIVQSPELIDGLIARGIIDKR